MVNWSGHEAGNSHLVPRQRRVELYLHSPIAFMVWCFLIKNSDTFIYCYYFIFIFNRQHTIVSIGQIYNELTLLKIRAVFETKLILLHRTLPLYTLQGRVSQFRTRT